MTWHVCGIEKHSSVADYTYIMKKMVFSFMERQEECSKRYRSCVSEGVTVWLCLNVVCDKEGECAWHEELFTIPALMLCTIYQFSCRLAEIRVWPHIFTFEYSRLYWNAIWMMWWPFMKAKQIRDKSPFVCSSVLLMVFQFQLSGGWEADITGYTEAGTVGT